MLRDAATNALASSGWTVLTGETMIQVHRGNGVKPEECGIQACHLEMAREIKAQKFLSGSVQHVEGLYVASIRLVDTSNGRIVASERLEGQSVTILRREFEAKALLFFTKGGIVDAAANVLHRANTVVPPVVDSTGPQIKTGPVTEAVVSLAVTAKPKELVRIELMDPSGRRFVSAAPYKNDAAEPGRWTIVAKASGYEDEEQEVIAPADDVAVVKFELQKFGGLAISASVTVRGPAHFKDEGGLPWEASGLRSGRYTVDVARKGYLTQNETIDVSPGATTTLRIQLRRDVPATGKRTTVDASAETLEHIAERRARECRDNNAGSCSELGLMYFDGFGVEKDEEFGMDLVKSACKDGDAFACNFARKTR